nr:hypothetical protein [Tanacetum cinerariifolium]
MSSDSHATITYTSMSSYEVIVNGYFGMPMDPLDPYAQLVMEAPPSPDYIPKPEVPPLPDYIPGPEYPEYLPPADDVFPAEEQPLPAAVSPTAESPGYITDSEPKMDPEEEDGDDEKSERDSIDYPTSRGDDDVADDDGDDLSKDDADDEDEEESLDNKEEEEEHLALTVPAPALHTTPQPSAYRITARISVRPYIPMPFPSESEVERLLVIPTPPLSPVSPTSYPLPPFLMPLPIFTPLPPPPPIILPRTRASMTGEREAIFLHLVYTYAQEVAHSCDYCTQIMDYCQSREKMAPKRARTTRANPNPTRTTTATEPITQEAINNLIAQRVTEALAEYETQKNSVVNEDTSHTTGTGPITVRPTRECTYKDYLNCGPLKFNGTEGVISLTRCALTWWNSHMSAVSQEVAYAMPWKTLRQMMTTKYYPRGEVKKLEVELWNLKIERYVGGLPEMIRGNVMSYESKSMQKAIEFANDKMDQKLLGIADRSGEKKPYGGTKPLCPKCNFHHDGPCGPKCTNCKRTGHIARDCRSRAANTKNNNNNNYNNRRATTAYQGVPTCFECGAQGHFKNNFLKFRNKNQGNRNQGNQNQAGNGNAMARAYGVGTAGRNPDANVVTGRFLLNNRCASILFDTDTDKSFVSTAFSSLININPSTLDYSYDVELADGQIIRVNTVIRGCTLNFLNHPFNIDLMPVELGSFDVIIGMGWLTTYHAVIVCDEKIVCVPFGNETLIIRCDGSNNGTQLNIISCTKTRKYLLKGYPVFLANITTKTIKDKSEEKRLENVPIV